MPDELGIQNGGGQQQTFSTTIGFLYIFNLIVGTGALALPRAFQSAGYVLSVLLLFISALTSYICATFVIESMAIANFLSKLKCNRSVGEENSTTDEDNGVPTAITNQPVDGEQQELLTTIRGSGDFEITRRIELGEMAHLFLGKAGTVFTYAVLVIYLFGDLSIYSATVPKSMMNVICASFNASAGMNYTLPCHLQPGDLLHGISRSAVYQFCILAFILFCLPMIWLGMTKTKWLQVSTVICRWTAFLLMIILASVQLFKSGPKGQPPASNLHGFGSLFGVAVYAFMCHHSIPGLITPIRDKSHLNLKLISVYILVYLFYCALSLTGSFAFAHVQDVYTINFLHDGDATGFFNFLVNYSLALFPVFVLTSSYIIVAITLCNNIRVLITLVHGGNNNGELLPPNDGRQYESSNQPEEEREALLSLSTEEQPTPFPNDNNNDAPMNFHATFATHPVPIANSSFLFLPPNDILRHLIVPVIVVLLPAMLSLMTNNVLLLASVTGSFPGVAVQNILPALLVLGARRALAFRIGCMNAQFPSQLRTPFSHRAWPFAIICWSIFAVLIVSANFMHLG